MAAPAIPEPHLRQARGWCQQRIPAWSRDQVQVEHRVRGYTVTIVEQRPRWSPTVAPEWTTIAIAQLRYRPRGAAGGCTGLTATAAGIC
jgi:hypothetical protein